MTKRRAIIHIGTPKTGSTTIQEFLAINRESLLEGGFAYPVSPGKRSHHKLAGFGSQEAHAGPAQRPAEHPLAYELKNLPDHVRTVIFSSEHLTNKLASADQVGRFKDFLEVFFDKYLIVVYLRRQDEYVTSLYSTHLRMGSGRLSVLPGTTLRKGVDFCDWGRLLERWESVFGRENIIARLFSRDDFFDGDLIADFRTVCGLDQLALKASKPVINQSLIPAAQEFLRQLNLMSYAKGEAEKDDIWDHTEDQEPPAEGDDSASGLRIPFFIRQILGDKFSGAGRRPSRAEAEAFVRRYSESNERIRARYFPNRETLFKLDFSSYPDHADPAPPSEEVLQVSLEIIRQQLQAGERQRAGSLVHHVQLQLEDGKLAEAQRLLRRILLKEPTNAEALAVLVRMSENTNVQKFAERRLAVALRLAPEREDLLKLRKLLLGKGGVTEGGRLHGALQAREPDLVTNRSEITGHKVRPQNENRRQGAAVIEDGARPKRAMLEERIVARRQARQQARAAGLSAAAPADPAKEERRALRRQREERRAALAVARGESALHEDPPALPATSDPAKVGG